MASPGPVLTIHRAAHEIGGNCIELEYDGHRLLLDAGSPLDAAGDLREDDLVPRSLDVARDVAALVVSHPHQDHYGLLSALPESWPVWCGQPSEELIKLTAALAGKRLDREFRNYRSGEPFTAGPFTVTPFLTDHSAFDAHILLVECGGRRVLYSGDFRRVGRKSALVDRFVARPPADVDVLLLEGTTLGRRGPFPTEAELEEQFLTAFLDTGGRAFISWSAQNIDRTVTIYRACKRANRTLVLDIYTLDVLERLSSFYDSLPRLGWPAVQGVITASMKRLYEDPDRIDNAPFVEACGKSGRALGAARLQELPNAVVMLRPSLLRDFLRKGLALTKDDTWIFSMWGGYMSAPSYAEVRAAFESANSSTMHIHTSGHASRGDLLAFARGVRPRHLVPIHSFEWDDHVEYFENVTRLKDAESFVIP